MTEQFQLSLYDQLLQFQLFQGMSRSELLQMAGYTRFGFQKVAAGEWLVRDGDACQQLFFLVRGSLSLATSAADHAYTVVEQLQAPWLLQPEALFGLTPHYTCSVRTTADCQFITLKKDEVVRLLDDFLIFRVNMLNLLATTSQRLWHRRWRPAPLSLQERVIRFFTDHVVYPAGPKEVHILMTQLARQVSDTRLNVSRVLNALQERELVRLQRAVIVIPSLEQLLMKA
jgi:CRP-like cAMP-binding protein